MDSLLKQNLLHLRRLDRSPNTIEDRQQVMTRFREWLAKPLAEATSDDLNRWMDQLRPRVSQGTICTYSAHVCAFYVWAYSWELIDRDPTVRVIRPSRPRYLPRPIPEKHLSIALRTASGQLFAMLVLGAYLGLRAAEIAGIRREHVSRDDDGAVYVTVTGKGRKTRTVPLVGEIWEAVRPWLSGGRGPAFTRPKGSQATPQYVTRIVSEHFAGIGLPYVGHQLRHRFGTVLYDETRDIRLVQELMGHASITQTVGYVQANRSRQQAGMRRLAGDLGKKHRRLPGKRPAAGEGSAASAA